MQLGGQSASSSRPTPVLRPEVPAPYADRAHLAAQEDLLGLTEMPRYLSPHPYVPR